MIETICLFCNKTFSARKADLKRGLAKFCSRTCFGAYSGPKKVKEKRPNVECAECGKPFYRTSFKQSLPKSGLQFCSRACKDKAQRLDGIKEIHPSHYKDGKYSYREIALRNLPKKCNRCGYDEYIEILQVHHKDENRSNPSLDNLEVLCPNCHWKHHILGI